MPNYDFRSLSPIDFEDLVGDLLSADEGHRYEAFGRGRDSGIDLRHSTAANGSTIVQAKHYRDSGLSKLLSALKKEKPKVDKLHPTRYVLATSVSLTPSSKNSIIALLAPHVKAPADILGAEDLNALLLKHDDV